MKKILNGKNKLSITMLKQKAEGRTCALSKGLSLFADLAAQKIISRRETHAKTSISVNEEDFKIILSKYEATSTTAEKKRVLREALVLAGLIKKAISKTKYRGKKGNRIVYSKQDYILCINSELEKENFQNFINNFAGRKFNKIVICDNDILPNETIE